MSNIEYGPQPPVGPDVEAEQRLVDAISGKDRPKIFAVLKVERPSVHIEGHDSRGVEISVRNEGRSHTFVVPRAPLVVPETRNALQKEET